MASPQLRWPKRLLTRVVPRCGGHQDEYQHGGFELEQKLFDDCEQVALYQTLLLQSQHWMPSDHE